MKNRLRQVLFALLIVGASGSVQAQKLAMEDAYNALSARFEKRVAGDQNLPVDLRAYLAAYPYSTYQDEVQLMYGIIQVEKNKKDSYAKPLKELLKVEKPKRLSRPHYLDYLYYTGYCYVMDGEVSKAQPIFRTLLADKDKENPYRQQATYYLAYCNYRKGEYDAAMTQFKSVESKYSKTAPYYIVQMQYARHQYDEVKQRAEELLAADPDNENNAELHRMLGEIYYQQGDYTAAADHLQKYERWIRTINSGDEYGHNKPKTPLEFERNDMYLLGMTHYQLGDDTKAVEYLKKVKAEKDTISESTFMTLGNIYIRQKNIAAAKLNYESAANIGLTPALTEEAAYNYAMTTYQSASALGDAVGAFDSFLSQYPNSRYIQHIYALQCDAYMQANNKEGALAVLDKNPQQTPQILQTKQYLRYQLGADAFLQGKMDVSRTWMTEVIGHRAESSKYYAEALYWRAEASYRLRDFMGASKDIADFARQPEYATSAHRLPAMYLAAYADFSQKNYPKAKTAFEKYIAEVDPADRTYTDALNRIGDCYFNDRNFKEAITSYSRVILQSNRTSNVTGVDYATFQRGYANGLLHNYDAKVVDMSTVVSKYPKSDFVVQALYELARAQIELHQEPAAIKTFDKLLNNYGRNPKYGAKSALERAMLYRNIGKSEEAIKAYKYTISHYPSTDEAYTALSSLEAMYVESNRVSEYVKYTKSLKTMKVVTKDDSLTYAAAELLYMQAHYREAAAAMVTYRQQYGVGSRYYTIATYYAADCLYRLKDYEQALPFYEELSSMSGNPYIEEASIRAAEISYDQKNYGAAKKSFEQLLSVATTNDNKSTARLGILRCSYLLKDYASTIDIATTILDQPIDASIRQEAMYNRAKAYNARNDYRKALPDLAMLSVEVRTAIGAESKYQLAQAYFDLGDSETAEQQIMSFTEMQTTQQYWLARAIILLSDISLKAGDDFQARQYLLSLQANYTANDDIQTIVAQRLAAIDQTTNEEDEEN